MSNVNALSNLAAAPLATQVKDKSTPGSWFEALAQAWGNALDKQADAIQAQSGKISGGDDTPATVTELTAQSLKMGFLSNSAHSSISGVSEGLNTMARKG